MYIPKFFDLNKTFPNHFIHFGFANEKVKHCRPDHQVQRNTEDEQLWRGIVGIDYFVNDSRNRVKLHQ